MDICGYVTITDDAIGIGIEPKYLSTFRGKDLRVLEFDCDGGALVVNNEGNAVGMFDKNEIKRFFKCSYFGDFICPPGIDHLHQHIYVSKCMTRKGGYDKILHDMIVQASLMMGKYVDSFLWELQDEEFKRSFEVLENIHKVV